MSKKLKIAIIGVGRVGSAMAIALDNAGYQISCLLDKDPSRKHSFPIKGEVKILSNKLSNLPSVDIVLLAVPDDEIQVVVAELVAIYKNRILSNFLFHTSGVLSSDIFQPLRKKYAIQCASLHPIQTFPGNKDDYKKLRNIYFGIEGDDKAIMIAKNIIKSLGSRTLVIPKEFKPIYHLACTIASNYLHTLVYLVIDLFKELKLSEKEIINVIFPLISTTVKNIHKNGLENTLTGPIARGDVGTVKKHLEILSRQFPQYEVVYKQLGQIALSYPMVRENVFSSKYKELKKYLDSAENKKNE